MVFHHDVGWCVGSILPWWVQSGVRRCEDGGTGEAARGEKRTCQPGSFKECTALILLSRPLELLVSL